MKWTALKSRRLQTLLIIARDSSLAFGAYTINLFNGATTLSMMTLSITTLSIMTFSIVIFSIMTLSMMTFSIITNKT